MSKKDYLPDSLFLFIKLGQTDSTKHELNREKPEQFHTIVQVKKFYRHHTQDTYRNAEAVLPHFD